uniref:TBC1 domain family member 23 n=1 Tax=Phallusia mammillata TaxID=59560 RepID=A0A6F9DTR9_9ASCI|nr:TBC1 domain family member 23-like [Phallusia mammillata]
MDSGENQIESLASDELTSDLDDTDSPVIVDDEDGAEEEGQKRWHEELEEVLAEGFVDQGIIKGVCKCRSIPHKFRSQVWKICLNVASRADSMASWDGKLDLQNQGQLEEECTEEVEALFAEQPELELDGIEKTNCISDAVAVITFYCKCRALKFTKGNGFVRVLKPLLALGFNRADLYNCFYAMMSRYVPRMDLSSNVTNATYNLLRLLLLYHDPEMCSRLDTLKVSMESFSSSWFTTIFASHCSTPVVSAIWDIYLQKSDPFFILYLALVILLNAKEQIMMSDVGTSDKQETIESLINAPSVLTAEDVDDFCLLASYYNDRTPSSFRRELGGCFYSGTMVASASKVDAIASDLAQAFCLKVSIPELLLSSQPSHGSVSDEEGPKIRFFVVDCRPAQEYNRGHLLTAFHLDATLMLKEPSEFDTALSSLFTAQQQAIQAGSAAGGEHLCFIGSGNEEDDQYMYMVVANLLQKRQTYVSLARGGYAMLVAYLADVGIDLTEWIVGAECEKSPSKGQSASGKTAANADGRTQGMQLLMKKMAGNLFEKSVHLKDKVTRFIENVDEDWSAEERHIQASDKSKPYRGTQSVFSIGDENEHDDEEESEKLLKEQVIEELESWTSRSDVKHCYECQYVNPDGQLFPAYLALTDDEMYCLLVVKGRKERRRAKQTWVRAKPPRLMRAIVKITSRRSFPELISFKFGDLDSPEVDSVDPPIVATDRYILPDAGTATKNVKYMIIEAEKRYKQSKSDQPSTNEPSHSGTTSS